MEERKVWKEREVENLVEIRTTYEGSKRVEKGGEMRSRSRKRWGRRRRVGREN